MSFALLISYQTEHLPFPSHNRLARKNNMAPYQDQPSKHQSEYPSNLVRPRDERLVLDTYKDVLTRHCIENSTGRTIRDKVRKMIYPIYRRRNDTRYVLSKFSSSALQSLLLVALSRLQGSMILGTRSPQKLKFHVTLGIKC